jgi:hypothetical protein
VRSRLALLLCCALASSCATFEGTRTPATSIAWDTELGATREPPSRESGGGLLGYSSSLFSIKRSLDADWDGVPLSSEEFISIVMSAVAPNSRRQAIIGAIPLNVQPQDERLNRWKIQEINSGTIVTEWMSIRGKTAGLWLWKKEYLTEVRHTISVRPATRNRSLLSYSIKTEVRERPNAEYPWVSADVELGRTAQSEIRAAISTALDAATKGKVIKK